MSVIAPAAVAVPPPPRQTSESPQKARRIIRYLRIAALWLVVCAVVVAAGWYGYRVAVKVTAPQQDSIPTAKVQRGDVTLSVTARGELRGGNSEVLVAPMTGGTEMHITTLRTPGEEVKSGDTVVQLDTTEQEYKLREAEADLAEAQQKLAQLKAQEQAEDEENRYAILKAQSDILVAELDVKKNPLLGKIVARENDLALEAARDKLAQLQRTMGNKKATNAAGIATQEAAISKAESAAKTARQNIEAMTLKTHRPGYVSVKENQNQNFWYDGLVLPLFQSGDAVRPGMAIAEIPDLKDWVVVARISELDRGHLAAGNKVAVSVVALPARTFSGRVKGLGSTNGPFWDRKFEVKIGLDNPSSELRPGMSANVLVATEELHNVLSLPAQALFESDGRQFVYVRSGAGFQTKDVKLERRNESRVVITGIAEGSDVALANPTEVAKKKAGEGNALQSLRGK